MRARPRDVLLVAVVAGLLGVACSDGTEDTASVPLPTKAEGLITEMCPAEGEPESFLLETENDGTLEVFLADDVDYGFDLQHLHEHMNEDLPVRVQLEERDGQAVATQIDDV